MAPTLVSPPFSIFTIEDYFETEEQSERRHEFFYGHVYATARAHIRHGTIALNLAEALRPRLREKGCLMAIADFQIVTPTDGAVFYPDASVFCGRSAAEIGQRCGTPSLVLEVLSPSTRSFDLSGKRVDTSESLRCNTCSLSIHKRSRPSTMRARTTVGGRKRRKLSTRSIAPFHFRSGISRFF